MHFTHIAIHVHTVSFLCVECCFVRVKLFMCLQCYLCVLYAHSAVYMRAVLFMSVQCHFWAHSAVYVRTVIFMYLQCYLRALYAHSVIYVRTVLFVHTVMVSYMQNCAIYMWTVIYELAIKK